MPGAPAGPSGGFCGRTSPVWLHLCPRGNHARRQQAASSTGAIPPTRRADEVPKPDSTDARASIGQREAAAP
eukprot:3675834-Alexandrium_andersonii.AAC.1